MLSSLIAVLGTLAGSISAYALQQRSDRARRAADRAEARRSERLAAITALVAALADHRRAMWVREDLRLSGDAPDAYAAARAESHATRSAITAPLTAVRILAPDLADLAEAAADATYALRGTPDPDTLADRRTAATAANDRFIDAAGALI